MSTSRDAWIVTSCCRMEALCPTMAGIDCRRTDEAVGSATPKMALGAYINDAGDTPRIICASHPRAVPRISEASPQAQQPNVCKQGRAVAPVDRTQRPAQQDYANSVGHRSKVCCTWMRGCP